MPNTALRLMQLTDLTAISKIEMQVSQTPWPLAAWQKGLLRGHDSWVIDIAAEVQGYGIMCLAGNCAHILNFAIKPAYQRKGHGRRLLEHLISVARSKKIVDIMLEVRASNKPAIEFYEKIGFNKLDQRQKYYPGQKGCENALIFALQL